MTRINRLSALLAENEAAYITSRANIFYYSGFTSEDAALLITKRQALILTDSRYFVQAKLQAPDFVLYDIAKGLSGAIETLAGTEQILYEESYLTVERLQKLETAAKGCRLIPGQKKIAKFRQKKDAEEIAKIRAAEALGDAAFSYILDKIRPGVSEIEIALELEFFMRKNGASGLSFETIAASGLRSAMPHGVASEKRLEKGDFLTLDFGCVLDGYCSDMTRTVVIGAPDLRQKEIYETVLLAQETALSQIAPGVACAEIDRAAREVIQNAGYGDCFGHALGHSVGIEIHEMPVFSPKSKDVLEEGHVITVEPGIYLEGFGGVRIEDVVAVCGKKAENLTKSPKNFIII